MDEKGCRATEMMVIFKMGKEVALCIDTSFLTWTER